MRNHTHKPRTMQPFRSAVLERRAWMVRAATRALRRTAAGGTHRRVFPKSPRRFPGPLDNLPRPLSERDRSPRGRRRLLALVTVALVAGSVVGASQIAGSVALSPAGQVAGVVGTPPAGTSAPAVEPSSPPTRSSPEAPGVGSKAIDAVRHRGTGAPPVSTLTGYRWPLPHARVTLPFGPSPWGSRVVAGKAFHDGVDLATFCGDRIVAAHDGTVLAAGRHYDNQMGWDGDLAPYLKRLDDKHLWTTLPIVVVIDDGNGYRSIYAHFGKITVKRGQTVKAGKVIGYEGMTGRASGCHLHYGLFSPAETARFKIEASVAKRMKLPRYEIARIDPLRVLPERTKPPKPTPTPDPNAEPTPTPSPETIG
jgi:murein DD-endopeptidase MepM/ murein hydrolase activator NlpD